MADQKQIITPDHFQVAPELLGLPLASPSRRAFAMLIDLMLIAMLVQAGAVFLGFAAAFILFRASSRKQPGGSFIRRSVQTTLRIIGAIVLFVVITSGAGNLRDRWFGTRDDDDNESAVSLTSDDSAVDQLNLNLSVRDLSALGGSLLALNRAEDSASVQEAATEILTTAKRSGATPSELRDAQPSLVEMMGEKADSSRIRAVNAAVLAVAGTEPAVDNRVAEIYVTALSNNDTATAAAYRDSLKVAVAGSEIAALQARSARFEAQRDSLDRELDEARGARGVRSFVSGAADDLGVGFGWSAVFFTAFVAMWRGQTPGKRVAGVRVIRLDGKPIGWWIAFERFGGYAASFSVGLMGFFQILWDRNRQGLHDKACETVVIREIANTK